jgi:hypothetical protein
VLANQDVEHDSVNLVVGAIIGAIIGHRTHFGAGLSVAVHSSFTLLVARRVPREVVMEYRVKVALQVDAFTEAIRRHQHVLRRFRQSRDAHLPLGGSQFSRDRGDFDFFFQAFPEGSGHVSAVAMKRQNTIGRKPSRKSNSTMRMAFWSLASLSPWSDSASRAISSRRRRPFASSPASELVSLPGTTSMAVQASCHHLRDSARRRH